MKTDLTGGESMDKRNKFLLVALLCAAALLIGGIFLCFLEGAPLHSVEVWLGQRIGKDLFSYYTAQLSLTFITISVMTVLSEKSVVIYWENIAESRLIKPTFGCFAAFSWYSIIANIGAALGVFLRSCTVFTVFFATNILVLILLTNAIIDVYYGKDAKKKLLVRQLKTDFAGWRVDDPEAIERYTEKIYGLQRRVRQVHLDTDLLELRELYQLYEQEYPLFATMEAKPFTEELAESLDLKTDDLFLNMLTKVVEAEEARLQTHILQGKEVYGEASDMSRGDIAKLLASKKNVPPQENPYGAEIQRTQKIDPFQECEIWMALVKTRALKRWVSQVDIVNMRNAAYHDFIRLVKRRLVSIYNYFAYFACLSREQPECVERVLLRWTPIGEVVWHQDGTKTDPQELAALIDVVFEYMTKTVYADDGLYVMWHVMRDFYIASKQNENVGMMLGEYCDFPIPMFMMNWAWGEEVTILNQLMNLRPGPLATDLYL